jgi:hypothetical protein
VLTAIKKKKLEEFYNVDHLAFIALQLQPVIQSHARMIGQDLDAEAVSTETARMICLEHLAELEDISDPEGVIARWNVDKLAAQLAARSEL